MDERQPSVCVGDDVDDGGDKEDRDDRVIIMLSSLPMDSLYSVMSLCGLMNTSMYSSVMMGGAYG